MKLSVACFMLQMVSVSRFSLVSSKGLNGIHLRLTGYDNPPYDILKRISDGNYTVSGPNANVYQWLSLKLNFTYTVVDPIIDKVLIAKYNIYELAFDKIVNKEVDGLMGSVIMTPDRAARMDFTSMVWTEPYTIVARKPGQQSRLFAFIRPFQPTAWLCLLISVIVVIFTMSCFSMCFTRKQSFDKGENSKEEKKPQNNLQERLLTNTLGFYLVYVMNILTNHGMYTPFSQHSFRILAAGWLLAALVLVNSYSSIVVSSLTVPIMEPAINTFEDLANSKDVSVILHKNVVLSQVILGATSGVFKTLGDQARRHPDEQLHLNYPSLVKNLETGRYAYPFIQSYNRNFVVLQYKKDGKCRFQLSPPLQTSTGYFCFLFQKQFPHTATFSLGLTYLWETGLTRYWVQHELPNVYECFDQNTKKTTTVHQVVPIKLGDLISAFLILGIGLGSGVLVFLIELIISYYMKKTMPEIYLLHIV